MNASAAGPARAAVNIKEGWLMGRLRHHVSSAPSIVATGLLSVFLAAAVGCGDDDGGDDTDDADDADDDTDDDGTVDASVADAAPLGSRSGLIAVTETVVTNELPTLGPAPVISGAVVSINFVDDDTVTVPPLPDFDSNINGCAITVYDVKAGDEEPVPVDEGPFVVSGTANGEFACAFEDATGEYACQSTDPLLAAGSAEGATVDEPDGFGFSNLVMTGAGFAPEMAGMRIFLTGFEDKGGDSADGIYPIVGVVDDETLVITDFPFAAAGLTDATYSTFVGTGPMFSFGTVDFLDDGTEDVVIDKADSDLVPGFSMTAGARGEGLFLTKDSNLPHEFPFKADDIIFACDGKDCGADPEQEGAQLDAMVINGVTTDVLPLKGDDGFTMLPAENSFATFSCSMIGSDTITIPLDGVQAILDTNPARIQMTVGRFVAQLENSDTSGSTVVLGHSLTGFTTFKPGGLAARAADRR
jgi:hypothetical protein